MKEILTPKDLLQSCKTLFGPEVNVSLEFLHYLQSDGLKSIYRKRALETHPDRQASRDPSVRKSNNVSFHAIRVAYENLFYFLQTRNAHTVIDSAGNSDTERQVFQRAADMEFISNRDGQRVCSAHRSIKPIVFVDDGFKMMNCISSERLYQGTTVPQRQLLFGHYLYYTGLTNWKTITRILILQRMGRPRLGELGHSVGIFSKEDVIQILRSKAPLQTFGQTAKRMGMLNENQLHFLFVKQQRLQKRFGTILVEKNLLNRKELLELLYRFDLHNKKFGIKNQ